METFFRQVLIIAVFSFFALTASAGTFKAEDYKEIESNALKLQVEEYRNKKICYTGLYMNTMTTFPPYAEKNGIKAGKYFWLVVNPDNVPVIARKDKGLDDKIIALKRGCTVKIYGKIKKFKYKPELTMLPPYYLELVEFEVTKEPEKEMPAEGDGKIGDKFRQWRKERQENRRIPPPKPPQ